MPQSPSPFPPPPDSNPRAQADYWLTVLSSELATECEHRDFQAWLESDPAHRLEWERAEAFWQNLELLAMHGAHAQIRPRPRRTSAWVAAAAMLLLTVGGWFLLPAWLFAAYGSGAGEQRSVQLADGSRIELDTRTDMDFTLGSVRKLILYRGQIRVQAAPGAEHPFEVQTPFGRIRALGTAFNVRLADDHAVITVLEHAVRVMPIQGEPLSRLEQGQQATLRTTAIDTPAIADVDRATSWLSHRLIFQDQPLKEVLSELNRYRVFPYILAAPGIGKAPISGIFDPGNSEEVLALLKSSLKLDSLQIPGAWVVLYTR